MIILIGFPKSGTCSFQDLFIQLGYNSLHWRCREGYIGTIIQNNKKKGLPLLTGFEKYDCITQMDVCMSKTDCYWPQLVDFKQLYYENKEAIFILNKRDPVNLLASFKKWREMDKRLYRFNPEIIHNKTDAGFIDLVINHYMAVETFFSSEPSAKFIAYDIEKDTIDTLKTLIDIKHVSVFPKKNVNTMYK